MNHWKRHASLLLALVMCLSLAACGDSSDPVTEPDVGGTDWRTTGVWRGDGTITRGGEDTNVLVCVHKADATFYYDTEDQTMFGYVDYPVTLEGDPWEMFQGIDFPDLNGDGNSDVTMRFDDGGSELRMVWFWDTGSEQYVYQPEESRLGEADDGRGDLVPDERVLRLMFDALPFANVKTLQSENHEDGTYYYAYGAEDGLISVVNMSLPNDLAAEQTVEDYLADCALTLGGASADRLQTVEINDAFSEKMTYPVYIVTYTAGGNEDTREWTVFAMGTDSYTYLFGFGTMLDAAEDVRPVYQDIFASLYLTYEEKEETA